jgi:hypothetical protein
MNGELKVGILYIALHNQLKKKFGTNHIVPRKEIVIKLGRFQQLPRGLIPLLLKEMEERGLILKIDRDNIKILPCTLDIENNTTKFFELAGLLEDSNTKCVVTK